MKTNDEIRAGHVAKRPKEKRKVTIEEFCKEPTPGQYLIFQEYREGRGGDTYPVVDIVTFSENDLEEDDEDQIDPRVKEVRGWCDSTGYDGIVTLELWGNGEVYLSGDGVNHPRYRVTEIREAEYNLVLDDSDDLTDMSGAPVYYGPIQHRGSGGAGAFIQDSWDDQPGIKVEYEVQFYHLDRWWWGSRKAFGKDKEEVDELVALAKVELVKPKYYLLSVRVKVSSEVVWSAGPESV